MSYTLQELTSEDLQLLRAAELDKSRDNSHDENKVTFGESGGIVSVLSVVQNEDEDQDHERGLLDKLKTIFSSSKMECCEYKIILYQEIVDKTAMGFLLYEGGRDQDDDVFEAFEALQSTLEPLLHEGKVKLTKDLLEELISPKPMEPTKIRGHLVELIKHNSAAHPEWNDVVGTLDNFEHHGAPQTVSALSHLVSGTLPLLYGFKEQPLSFNFSSGEENLRQSLASAFTVHPVTGAKEMDMAVGGVAAFGIGGAVGGAVPYFGMVNKITEGFRSFKGFPGLEGINSSDNDGKTLLMIAVEKRYIDCCMYLLLGGSDPDKAHCDTGNTPLHLAVQTGSATLVKMMLIFNAEVAIANREGKTALDYAKESDNQEICDALELAKKRLEKSKSYFEANKSVPESRGSNDTYLLSMDGGGIRAFNIAQAIIAIDNRMQQLDPNCEPFISYFDYVAGTSSGGIAALLLAYTDASPATSRAVVYKIITDVFAKSRNKRGHKMKQYLQDILHMDLCMADKQNPRVIITSTLANVTPSKLHLMTNYGDPRDKQLGPKDRKVWEAGRATSAAPHHFPPFNKYFLDGGIMANNPTVDAMAEVLGQLKEDSSGSGLTCVLSLGSGCTTPTEVDTVDMYLPGFNLKTLAKIPRAVMGISNLVTMLLNHISHADGEEVTRARSWCNSIGCDFFRVTSTLEEEIDPTATEIDKVVDMLFNTEMQLLDCPEKIDQISKKLLTK